MPPGTDASANQQRHAGRKGEILASQEYERTENRKGHANGFKPKTVKTRMGEITFAVPQVREGGFYPSALEKGLRSERALTITLAKCTFREYHAEGESHHRAAMWG